MPPQGERRGTYGEPQPKARRPQDGKYEGSGGHRRRSPQRVSPRPGTAAEGEATTRWEVRGFGRPPQALAPARESTTGEPQPKARRPQDGKYEGSGGHRRRSPQRVSPRTGSRSRRRGDHKAGSYQSPEMLATAPGPR